MIAALFVTTGCILIVIGVIVGIYQQRHKHRWTVMSQEEQPAPIMNLKQAGITSMRSGGWEDSWTRLSKRDVIVKRKCDECGTEEVVRV